MLTPKEINGGGRVYPVDVPYSALLEAGYSSSGAPAADATIALSFKPTAADTAHPLCDPTNHYLLLIVKTGTTVEVFRSNVSVGSYTTTATTYAGLLSEALTTCCGSDHGYYSNIHVADGSTLAWTTFFELSEQVADLWMWKDAPTWAAPALYVTGNRSSAIAASSTFTDGEGTPGVLIDGSTNGSGWYPSSPAVGQYLQFLFDDPTVITEMTVYSSTTATRGQWKWQGSVDGVDDWTDLTASWTLGGGTAWADVSLSGNGTAYKGYRLVLTENSGQLNAYWFELEFKVQSDAEYGVNGGFYAFADGASLGADSSGLGNDWTLSGTQSDDTSTHNGGFAGADLVPTAETWTLYEPGTTTVNGVDSVSFENAGIYAFAKKTLPALEAGEAYLIEGVASGVSGTFRLHAENAASYVTVDADGPFSGVSVCGGDEFFVQGFTENASGTFSGMTVRRNPDAWDLLDAPGLYDTARFADLVLRSGTGAAAAVDSLGFQPDMVNVKDRSSARSWHLYDALRGAAKSLGTDANAIEETMADGLTAFSANGYALGTDSDHNADGDAFLDLALKADPRAGFDIVTWTGDGTTGRQIAHNLQAVPKLLIVKNLTSAWAWCVYHEALGGNYYLEFDTDAVTGASSRWNSQVPAGTFFTLGTAYPNNAAGDEYVAYLFADTDVFKVFSYTGNGSSDGPDVDLGGRPHAIPFLKNATTAGTGWLNCDALRNTINPVQSFLSPNAADAETTAAQAVVFRSSGFKPITTGAAVNANGDTYVGLAVLRQPYKYSNAF